MSKNNLIFIISAILILFLISNISALGITPGRTTIDFSPNLEKDVQFSVINSENKNMNVAFAIQGEPEEIITLNNKVVHFNIDESSKSFSYKIKLPSELPPGLHKLGIVAIEIPKDIDNEEIIVKSTVGVVTQLYVYVPYPGKYLDANLDIIKKEKTNLISFYIPIISRGTEEIEEVKGIIKIYQDNKEIAEIETNKLSILSGERKELLGSLDVSEIHPGKYKARVIVSYDGNELNLEKELEVGKDFITILGVSTNDFQLGEVARIKILVQNLQQNKIDRSYANLDVYDSGLIHIVNLKSEDYEIPGLSNKELIVYWDTENIEEGQYTSELKTNYDEKILTKNLKMDISKNSIIFSGIGFVIAENSNGLNIKNFLIMIIGILVLVNVLWFLWWLRKKKERGS